MLTVNDKGFICSTTGGQLSEKAFFPVTPFKEKLVSKFEFMNKVPVVFQILDKILDLDNKISLENISLTEKNKGGEYQSSAFMISTKIESFVEITDAQYLLDLLMESAFTLKNASFFTAMQMYSFVKEATSIDLVDPKNKDILEEVKKDSWLVDLLLDPQSGTTFLTTYKSFVFKDIEDIPLLNVVDQARYLAFVTKYMEIEVNQTILTPEKVVQEERLYWEQQYLLWLIKIFQKSFKWDFKEYEG